MVKEIKKDVFQCEECKLFYSEKEIAKKCQDWCSKHNSCNIEIISNAIEE